MPKGKKYDRLRESFDPHNSKLGTHGKSCCPPDDGFLTAQEKGEGRVKDRFNLPSACNCNPIPISTTFSLDQNTDQAEKLGNGWNADDADNHDQH